MSLVSTRYSPTVLALLEPIDERARAGLFDIEDETYQAIDQEMIKLGGLHESAIDWAYIEQASRQYLSLRCKQFRVMGHLVTAWLRQGQWASWSDALGLLVGMVEHYWEGAFPKPGPTGYPAKRRQVELMLERLGEALPALNTACRNMETLQSAREALLRLQVCVATTQLDTQAIARLQAQLLRQDEAATVLQTAHKPGADKPLAWPARASNPGNEREQRQASLAMAETVNARDLYDPTGYLLRRFALWGHLQTAPAARNDRCTELPSVPREISQGYQDALDARAVEPALLLRIEKSVVASPFWIRGSYLAAGVAVRLAMEEVAAAIRMASARFVRRMPALMHLGFSDGTPFIDDQVRAWLTTSQQDGSGPEPVHEYCALRQELVAQLGSEGVEVVLLRLQALQASQGAPRQRCHASVIAADLLAARGLSWLAEDLYANAARLMLATTADAWEPDLYRRLSTRQVVPGVSTRKQ